VPDVHAIVGEMVGRNDPSNDCGIGEAGGGFSYFPAIPPPVMVRLTTLPEHPCPYLPGRVAQSRAIYPSRLPGELYRGFMDAGFRRSGRLVYQPICRGCRECRPIRVPVNGFRPDKSQRRCRRKNQDLRVEIAGPSATDEAFAVYQRYVAQWHETAVEDSTDTRRAFEQFLYESPVETLEFRYRDGGGTLLAVGICDVSADALSSVYFYFDPIASDRGLGTFGALFEIAHAMSKKISYYYLGYWITECRAMRYKDRFRPYELLHNDGIWREPAMI
jgi:arginyl-tRNA--protein-N-Asp/Glu arginylyltransferase